MRSNERHEPDVEQHDGEQHGGQGVVGARAAGACHCREPVVVVARVPPGMMLPGGLRTSVAGELVWRALEP